MTEQEWLTCTEPTKMVEFRRGQVCVRKLRLFMVACCHRLRPFIRVDPINHAIDLAERFADDLVTESERTKALWEVAEVHEDAPDFTHDGDSQLPEGQSWDDVKINHPASRAAWNALSTVEDRWPEWGVGLHEDPSDETAALIVSYATATGMTYAKTKDYDCEDPIEQALHCHLLRDIFGNPLRPVAFAPAWRTPTVTAVAQSIYAERRFADLPILADALEETGCTSVDLLAHCRTGGDHVRGCWALDLVLGKE